MYFDAVLDINSTPLFNGTPDETKAWLREHVDTSPDSGTWRVCPGRTMALVTVKSYLSGNIR